MRKTTTAFLVLLIASAIARPQSPRGPSTPEERKRFVAIAHKLEDAPLDKSLRVERNWALHWLIDIPDITVNPCDQLLGDLTGDDYRYAPEIRGQFTFSQAAFMIEHPDKAKDPVAVNLAALEGALKAYRAILKVRPGVQSESLDLLLKKQSDGKLAEYAREATKEVCSDTDDQKG